MKSKIREMSVGSPNISSFFDTNALRLPDDAYTDWNVARSDYSR